MKPADRASASDLRKPSLLWSRLHFVLRFLGLTGALACFAGLVLVEPRAWQDCLDALSAPPGTPVHVGGCLLAGGAAAVLLALLAEVVAVLRVAAGRRSAFGFNAVVQVALAAVLLAGVNWWSFGHSLRLDTTREGLFTLPAELRRQLGSLDRDSETTVVVYQRHKTFGALTDKPDRFDYAAERKVVEKVKDLVALLREVGPQLHVEVLDVEEEGYDDKLHELTAHAPELRKAIEGAAENSIFISNRGRKAPAKDSPEYVQQMSFNELYQLDKVQSQQDNGGRGNLVLLGQGADGRGVGPFVRRILNLEQRKPRVGVLVIHQLLTTRGEEASLTLAGLRKALTLHGFEVKDVVLKKGWDRGGFPEAAADTFEESRLEELEGELADLEDSVKELQTERKAVAAEVADLAPRPGEDQVKQLEELSKKYRAQLGGRKLTENLRAQVLALRQRELKLVDEELAARTKERDAKRHERDRLDVDRISEARRMTDVQSKLAYALADCDLLFVPRLTRMSEGDPILPRLYRLDRPQVDAIRDFLEAGKPLFACFGPINEAPNRRMPPGAPPAGPDALENLLGDLGIRMGRQTLLTAADSKAFSERRLNPLLGGTAVEVPPLDFSSDPEAIGGSWRATQVHLPPSPLREGLRVTARSVGKAFDVRLRFPRPVWYESPGGKRPAFDPVLLLSPVSWNEEQPFPSEQRRLRYTPPAPDDPNNGTPNARRRGQFPVGVAVEATLPASWGKAGAGKTVRVAAVGQGGLFVGGELPPPRERLLLQTVNWLLGRDDYLPRADEPWRYPRLALAPEDSEHRLWLWGTRLGLPVLFAYLGFVVLLFRRLR
jgi:hypothetical protein